MGCPKTGQVVLQIGRPRPTLGAEHDQCVQSAGRRVARARSAPGRPNPGPRKRPPEAVSLEEHANEGWMRPVLATTHRVSSYVYLDWLLEWPGKTLAPGFKNATALLTATAASPNPQAISLTL